MFGSTKNTSSEKECIPKQNDCSKAGVGPSCSEAEYGGRSVGAAQKKACLDEVKKSCEDAIARCFEECDGKSQDNDDALVLQFGPSGAGNLSTVMGLLGSPEKNIHGTLNYQLSLSDTYRVSPYNGWKNVYFCKSDCIRSRIDDCQTAHCYCGLFKCDSSYATGEAAIGPKGGGTKPPSKKDDPTTIYDTINKTSVASLTTTSAYDIPIEAVYGTIQLPGNIVWISDVRSSRNYVTTRSFDVDANEIKITRRLVITNRLDIHVALCAGIVDSVRRVWVDGKLLFDRTGQAVVISDAAARVSFSHLRGSESQRVSSAQAESAGFGRATAYRGVSLLLIENLNITNSTAFPNIRVEVSSSILSDIDYTESSTITGLTSTNLWRVDWAAGAVVAEDSSGVFAKNLYDFSVLWDEPVSSSVETTSLGKLITYNGVDIGVYEPGLGEAGRTPAILPIEETFILRVVDQSNSARTALFSYGSGNAALQEIDEVRPAFPQDSVGVQTLAGFDSAPPEYAITLVTDRALGAGKSTFMFRVDTAFPNKLVIKELKHYSSDPTAVLIEDGGAATHEIPSTVFGSTSSLVLKGVIPSLADGSAVILYSVSGQNFAAKWHVENGVSWTTSLPSLPILPKVVDVTELAHDSYAFIAPNNLVYSLNLLTGEYTSRSGSWPGLAGRQSYDHGTGMLVYHATGGKLVTLYLYKIAAADPTLEAVVKDLFIRSGLDYSFVQAQALSGIFIKGFRSGEGLLLAEALNQLATAYSFKVFGDYFIDAVLRGSPTTHVIDEQHLLAPEKLQIDSANTSNAGVSITYFSTDLDGEGNTQTYVVRESDGRAVSDSDTTYSFTLVETDTFMRQLAELLSLVKVEDGEATEYGLPPRYLAITPSDRVSLSDSKRVSVVEIGADSTMTLRAFSDAYDKYADSAPITGVPGFSSRFDGNPRALHMESPIGFSLKSIDQQALHEIGVFIGASDLFSEHVGRATVGVANVDSEIAVTSHGRSLSQPLLWGRLVVPPPAPQPAVFKTFAEDTLKVSFQSEEMAAYVLEANARYGESPDYRTVNRRHNLLAVGREFIQYGFASAVVGEPQSVVFHDLLRARENTDQFTQHVAGEFCAVVTENVIQVRVKEDTAHLAVNLGATDSRLSMRRSEVSPDEQALASIDRPSISLRHFSSRYGFTSSVHPTNPTLEFYINPRLPHRTGFSNETTVLNDRTFAEHRLFLLRAPYDPILFETERYGTGYSYIVLRNAEVRARVVSESSYTTGITEYVPYGYVWKGSDQSASGWNHTTEPLYAVIVTSSPYGEVKTIAWWPASGLYTRHKTGGLNG